MFQRRRLLKKEQHKKNKKITHIGLIACFLTGIILMVVGVVMIINQPLFITPLPKQGTTQVKISINTKDELTKLLNQENIKFTAIEAKSSDEYIIKLSSSAEVTIDPGKDLNTQIDTLQVILSRLTMEGKKFSRLDLRFDRPVIVLQ